MVVTIKSNSTAKEIEQALKKLNHGKKHSSKEKKVFDAYKYCGVIKLKEDPLTIQKSMRDEWSQ